MNKIQSNGELFNVQIFESKHDKRLIELWDWEFSVEYNRDEEKYKEVCK